MISSGIHSKVTIDINRSLLKEYKLINCHDNMESNKTIEKELYPIKTVSLQKSTHYLYYSQVWKRFCSNQNSKSSKSKEWKKYKICRKLQYSLFSCLVSGYYHWLYHFKCHVISNLYQNIILNIKLCIIWPTVQLKC